MEGRERFNASRGGKETMSFVRDNLTVIVTIRNRRNTLPRVMNYYKKFPANVIFLDSTITGPYPNAHIAMPNQYRHVPGKTYVQKLNDCLAEVKTKYSVVVCDDDFLVSEGIDYCLEFLEKHDNYSAVRGQEVALLDEFCSFETLDFLVERFDLFESDDVKERVHRAWTYFNGANVHNIMRTDVQKKIQEFHLEHDQFNAMMIYDKTLSFITALYGNIATLPVFYIVRSDELRATSLNVENSVYTNDEIQDSEVIERKVKEANEQIIDWKPHLKFRKDFLDCETKPLEDLAGVDRDYIEEMHSNLCSSEIRDARMDEILENYDVFYPRVHKLHGMPLLFRAGSGGDLLGKSEAYESEEATAAYFTRFRNGGNKARDFYPVLADKNVRALNDIIRYVKAFPL